MGSQSQAPQQAQARPMLQQSSSPSSNGMMAGGSVSGAGGPGPSRFNSLARQASIYSLTLDEFQNAINEPGKNFGSMNMDEFLKNIWTVEESQAMAAAMSIVGPGGNSGAADPGAPGGGLLEGSNVGNGVVLPRQASLPRQGSLTLPRTLSRKTVDEVWRDIHRSSSGEGGNGTGGPSSSNQQHRQTTFGEMTLEDFLVKAGVVREEGEAPQSFGSFAHFASSGAPPSERGNARAERGGGGALVPTLSLSPANALTSQAGMETMDMDPYKSSQQQQTDWLRSMQQQQMLHAHATQAAEAAAAYGNQMQKRHSNGAMVATVGQNGGYASMAGTLGPGLVPGVLGMSMGGAMGVMGLALAPGSPPSPVSDGVGHSHGNGLSLSPVGNYMDISMRGRKRGADGPVEKVVERRQRRMIKNRESAARSRARKQAYTVELEAEVTQLKEENNRLRKQQVAVKIEEEGDLRKKQILESMLMVNQAAPPGRSLRRTRTGPW